MNWFSGNIAEAVKLSKQRNSVFVVFAEGPNESSKELLALINTAEISSQLEAKQCVSIRIQSETESYTQFAEIYKLVPLPSLFLIGTNGVPLTIVTESTKTAAELDAKIRSALGSSAPAAQSAATSSSAASAANIEGSSEEAAAASINPQDSAADAQKKLEFYRAQIELKRKQKEEEQRKLEKEREIERRRTGQELRTFKERQNEIDLKLLKEERQRDRLQEQATRKRILEQIAQDRAVNNERFANSANASNSESPPAAEKPLPKKYNGTEARIQFKKPDGSVETHEFVASDNFQAVRDFVTNTLFAGNVNFTLASSFPRRLFSEEDSSKTLIELDLAPTSVILIMSSDKALHAAPQQKPGVAANVGAVVRGYDIFGMAQTVFWTVISPILTLFGYLRGLLGARASSSGSGGADAAGAQKRENEERISDNDAAKRRNLSIFKQTDPQPSTSSGTAGGAYKRPAAASNIHRLQDTHDSDDDTNTWNGNSTQQQ